MAGPVIMITAGEKTCCPNHSGEEAMAVKKKKGKIQKKPKAKKIQKVKKIVSPKVTFQTTHPRVRFETTQGVFTAEIYSDVPATHKNFLELTTKGFYDGLIFHRYEPGFVIQGGDPQGTGMGGSEKTIPLEITKYKHVKGALGMARSQDPNSASSQFYVCLADTPFLDGNYAVFGQVLEGMDKVLALRKGDKMTKVTIIE
jgi:peptidyl-prolyl cis-trans isomerase B (cyclophilin B)